MNNMDEILWNYIDGNCTADEQKAVATMIEQDEAVRIKYHGLLNLNREFAAMELDEPPMAFTYNVMEAIRAEHAMKPLKASINKRIIKGISIFFVLTITALLIFIISNLHFSAGSIALKMPVAIKLPAIKSNVAKPLLEGFFFFDLVMGLFLFDKFLRRKKIQKEA